MDARRSDGAEFPVSVWMKKVQNGEDPRVIVVIEPVAQSIAHFTLDKATRQVIFCEEEFATLFGYSTHSEVIGKSISDFLPSMMVPDLLAESGSHEQQLTGRTSSGSVFPATLRLAALTRSPSDEGGGSIDTSKWRRLLVVDLI